jgi:hypothetical protein
MTFHSMMWLVVDDYPLHWWKADSSDAPDEDEALRWKRLSAVFADASRESGLGGLEPGEFGARNGGLTVCRNRWHNHAARAPATEKRFFELVALRALSSYGVCSDQR